MSEIRMEEVIISELLRRGAGTPQSPIRKVLQVYSKDGKLIAENDSWAEENRIYSAGDLVDLLKSRQRLNIAGIKKEEEIVIEWIKQRNGL